MKLHELAAPRGVYQHYFAAVSLGRGLRLNNPYRLETVLGDDYESLSLTAMYFAASGGVLFGNPRGLQHGGSLQFDVALSGVRQEVLTPSYVAGLRLAPEWLLYGRFGLPIVLEPDLNVGAELGVGAVFHVWAGLGLVAETVGSMFYGAATLDRSVTYVPVVSLQLGVRADYEVLP